MDSKKENKIIFICWLAYASAYVGRLNFNASIVSIVDCLNITKSDAGLVGSFFFFAYGAGQLINGILSKRYNAKIMIFLSLIISAVLNVLMPISSDIAVMKYIWLINGIVQSVLWSTLIKTLSDKISDQKLPKAIVAMSTTVPVGTFIAYGMSSLFAKIGMWQGVFYVASVVMAVAAIVWYLLFGKDEKHQNVIVKKGTSKVKVGKIVVISLLLTAFAGIANGFVKDGINTWVPSVLYEEFNIPQSFSITITLALPLVATTGAAIVKKIHERIKSHSAMNLIFFAVSTLLCLGIILSIKTDSVVTVMLCFTGVACLMAMVNNVITSIFALDYRNVLNAGFAAGFLNTFCYVGSTVTSYSLGAVSQNSGWNEVFVIMLLICAAAAVICMFGMITESKRNKSL